MPSCSTKAATQLSALLRPDGGITSHNPVLQLGDVFGTSHLQVAGAHRPTRALAFLLGQHLIRHIVQVARQDGPSGTVADGCLQDELTQCKQPHFLQSGAFIG